MLSNILSTLSLARHVISITLVAGAATTMVAGSVDTVSAANRQAPKTEISSESAQHDETTASEPGKGERKMGMDLLVIDCLTKYAAARTTNENGEAASEACKRAIAESGLSAEDFWAKFASKAKAILAKKVEPQLVITANLEELIKDCFAKYAAAKNGTGERALASEACRKAITASGLTGDQFWAKFGTPDTTTKKTEPQTTITADLEALVKACFARYAAAKNSAGDAALAGEACHRAIEASGLTNEEFFKKFGKPEVKKTEPQQPSASANLETLVRECQAKYTVAVKTPEGADAARDACTKAVTASGLGWNDFWAKYMQPKTEITKPETIKKTETTTTTPLTELVKYCTTLKGALTSTSSRADIEKASYVCGKAGLVLN